jgi:hypothetical protein
VLTITPVNIVVNHIHLREPVPAETVASFGEVVQTVVDAGARSARVVQADPTHLILLLEFESSEDAARVARDVGGPWMRTNIVPLLSRETERTVGEVIVSAQRP